MNDKIVVGIHLINDIMLVSVEIVESRREPSRVSLTKGYRAMWPLSKAW